MRRRRAGCREARQPVPHEALIDADLLYQVLGHDEHQRDEPQQHKLCSIVKLAQVQKMNTFLALFAKIKSSSEKI
jgi:hypothetical protein